MLEIHGETITLLEKRKIGEDPFGMDLYEETAVEVTNVLLGSPTFDQLATDLNLLGKRTSYILGIPKGDTHDWRDVNVIIHGEKYRTYGEPLTQLDANVPGPWNTQVKVERYG